VTSTLYRGCQGVDVLTLQKLLGIEADGDFGPKTEAAVKAFQTKHGLIADGMVGPVTWSKLHPNYTKSVLTRAEKYKPGPVAEKAIEIALSYEGLKEEHGNRGALIDQWNADLGIDPGAPWCLSAIQQWFKLASRFSGKPDILKPDVAHCFTLWSKVPDAWKVKNTEGQRGDIGVLAISHVAIVLKNCGNGFYETIEGNTGIKGEREGKYVRRKTEENKEARKWSAFLGFIRIPEPWKDEA
jgi:hypothetical protein